jgi:2-succinyl-5-enolpyruvyl-6-hydroxy-3-cyclohexene-1-carboxylate synthase
MIPSYRDNLNRLPVWLYNAGVRDMVVAPGSRNAPLIAALQRYGQIRLHSARDERSAAFIALGFCLEGRPAAVCCTSGTALLNFYPAVCEAYYQRLPLIVISADRPPELIDQWDGQTIRQPEVFAAHVRAMVQWPDQLQSPYAAEDIDRAMNRALVAALGTEPGPVHINIPLRDPIYQGLDNTTPYPAIPWPGIPSETEAQVPEAWQTDLGKILVLCGQHRPDKGLQISLSRMAEKFPVLCDISSSMLSAASVARWETMFSFGTVNELLQADTLITCGTAMLNKQLKQWLRAHPPKRHWHLQSGGWTGDPFQSQPETVFGDPAALLDALYQQQTANPAYLQAWQVESHHAFEAFRERKGLVLRETAFSEWEALDFALTYLPDSAAVHFGNSMAVRYGAWIMPSDFPGKTFSNRGTSGIDGCVSTALGYAVAHPEVPCFLFVGDISFFYDSNAFWNTMRPDNLKVVLLNNGGGNIFRVIDGPRQLPECEVFLETRHQRKAEHLCRDLGIAYTLAPDRESLEEAWPEFLKADGPMVLELLFAPETAPRIFPQLKG